MFTNSISWNYVQNWSGQFQFVHSFLCGTTSQVTQAPLHVFRFLILVLPSPKETSIKPDVQFVILHLLASLCILALFYTLSEQIVQRTYIYGTFESSDRIGLNVSGKRNFQYEQNKIIWFKFLQALRPITVSTISFVQPVSHTDVPRL